MVGALGAYYALYVLNDATYIAWNAVAQVVGTFLVAAFIPKIVRTIGKRNGFIVLGFVGVVAGLILAFLPPSVPTLSLVGFFLLGIGMGGVNTLMWALEADTVEYGEWKTGIRTEGTTYAMFSFTRKMGQAIGGAAGAFALGVVGFNSAAAKAGETQSAERDRRRPAGHRRADRRVHPGVPADHVVLPADRQGVPARSSARSPHGAPPREASQAAGA